ncbi:MAG: antibiotic biosynthesis monooxygenase [Sphingobacteriales bacterium]|nr:MAG: antibiotic biosynthesis monooxygenase [Sphingobacteriales bacterium]
MIVRIVQMTFDPAKVDEFLALFEERKQTIRCFDGCNHLELWQDAHSTNIFFTYSMWESEDNLNHYRFSDFFKDTWAKTKALFIDKPQAWSVIPKVVVL